MSNKDTLLYLVSKLGSNSEGRKKIMKMMFLVNHFDVNKNSLVKTPFLNEDFIIYHYGVFSFKVMENFLDLSNEGKVKGDFPVDIKIFEIPTIPMNIKERVDLIIKKFGNKDGRELELETLGMLNLNLETKRQYFGEPVTNFIK
ncbi:MAG TPA: hypothetical protein VJB35_02280 [Candidatus Nanoarchaeia archaeon]|nr:hypothetical protein [Candidatus Nanoarchaeia archaeon]